MMYECLGQLVGKGGVEGLVAVFASLVWDERGLLDDAREGGRQRRQTERERERERVIDSALAQARAILACQELSVQFRIQLAKLIIALSRGDEAEVVRLDKASEQKAGATRCLPRLLFSVSSSSYYVFPFFCFSCVCV